MRGFALALGLALGGIACAAPLTDWRIQTAAGQPPGTEVSLQTFNDSAWYAAQVPTTVLAALAAAGEYPALFEARNLESVDASRFTSPWWFRTCATVPVADALAPGAAATVTLKGVNYRADVFCNGDLVASKEDVVGTFAYHTIDITAQARRAALAASGASARLCIAAAVHRPYDVFWTRNATDLAIDFVDWSPDPPDGNVGLWQPAELVVGSPVRLEFAMARTSVTTEPAPSLVRRPAITGASVVLTVRATNVASSAAPPSPAAAAAAPSAVTGTVAFTLAGLGPAGGDLVCPGKQVTILPGRALDRTSAPRRWAELLLARTAGLNALRVEGKFQSDELCDAMDELGIMALPGLCCCDAWQNWQLWGPEQERVAFRSVRDQLLRLRGRASMLAFLASSDQLPPAAVQASYDQAVSDAGWTLPVIAAASNVTSGIWGPSGVKMAGPYAWVPPSYWTDPAAADGYGGAMGFSTEISPGAAPMTLDSWNRTVGGDASLIWPEGGPDSELFRAHCGNPHGLFRSLGFFLPAFAQRYGDVVAGRAGVDAARRFLVAAQAAAMESHGAMFSGYRLRQSLGATGVVQWMANNAYPQHIWHLWDQHLQPGGSFYGAQAALRPVALLWDPFNGQAAVANDGPGAVPAGSRLEASLVGVDGKELYRQSSTMPDIPEGCNLTSAADLTALLAMPAMGAGVVTAEASFHGPAEPTDWYPLPPSHVLPLTAVTVRVSNTAKSAVAFQTRLRLMAADGWTELLTLWEDNFFSLLPGESREVRAMVARLETDPEPAVEVQTWNAQLAA
ncbi:hypothetical protein FNF31_03370 [Cafeteria roenbergensis]|uniref:Uncharacterized protein n=1 Tax=Cafeteria roenbergensis TaxID=33653 RepID=A0A5A8DA76_CAFRO|nr:hypothetical protein FNF31_03370 [Cafeteria roenbergensis]